MTLESDELAEAALKFSEAIRAERASTFDALANERQAALKIIQALKAERVAQGQQTRGRFFFGLALGVAGGIAAIYFVSQRASEEARLGITTTEPAPKPYSYGLQATPPAEQKSLADTLRERVQQALAEGQRAMKGREDELWQRYRQRLSDGQQPPPKADDFLY